MAHYKKYFDNELLGSWDLDGKDRVVTIAAVEQGTAGRGDKKSRKPILTFERVPKKFIANVTNCKAIAGMYGSDASQWKGKQITIYPTTTTFGSEVHDCIRVRPTVPNGKSVAITGTPRPADARAPESSGGVTVQVDEPNPMEDVEL